MNAFDKIKKSTSETKTSSKKITATVTDTIKAVVDAFVSHKAAIKALEAKLEDAEAVIIEHVRAQQDANAYKGDYCKSYLVSGTNCEITYTTTDRFSVPQKEEILKAIKKLIGDKKYVEFFKVKQSINLKDSVIKDEIILNKVAAACEKNGLPIAEIFDVGEKIVACDNLDEKQYTIPVEKLSLFRSLVRQYKAFLK
jgi:hypothetical protein